MKPLVFASYAQFGVDAEVMRFWATIMAYDLDPTSLWDLFLCLAYTCLTDGLDTMQGENLYVAKVMCSVACLEWLLGINDPTYFMARDLK